MTRKKLQSRRNRAQSKNSRTFTGKQHQQHGRHSFTAAMTSVVQICKECLITVIRNFEVHETECHGI